MKKRIVIIGATSTISEYCAREWAQQNHTELVLVGRNKEALTLIAQDLRVRAPHNQTEVVTTEFNDSKAIQETTNAICASGLPHIVLIAHGVLPAQNICQEDLKANKETLEINGVSPVLFAEAFAIHMDKADSGIIAMIGSVAGDRGRQSNYVYGAAKSLVAHYVQGMQHRFYKRNVKVILIKPGPTVTKMTAHLNPKGRAWVSAAYVAKRIVQGIAKGQSVIYVPKQWGFIMFILRNIPMFIFGKIKI